MKIVINDANILIDIAELDIVDEFFGLNLTFYTTDLVFNEIDAKQAELYLGYIEKGVLVVEGLNGDQLIELYSLSGKTSNLTDNDLSAYMKAQEHGGVLLTSDKRLRTYAEKMSCEVHGHLWVLEKMVEEDIISGLSASKILDRLVNEVNRKLSLPQKECDARIEKWLSG